MPLSEKRKKYMQEYRKKNRESISAYNKEYMKLWLRGEKRPRKIVTTKNGERRCYSCLITKPLEDFYRSREKPCGRMYMCKICHNAKKAEADRIHRLNDRSWSKRRDARFPEKYTARKLLRKAVASGKVKRGRCDVCGKKETHGHHEDYSKPLEVRWLCSQHHMDRHREMRAIEEYSQRV